MRFVPGLQSKWTLSLVLVIAGAFANGQEMKAPRKRPELVNPKCAQDAICFSGELRHGSRFRKHLTSDLDFVLTLPGGIDIVSSDSQDRCHLSSWVANPPLRQHHDTEIDAAYDWTAEGEVKASPREFRFPTNCADFERLLNLSQTDGEKYWAQLYSPANGRGRLWITDAKTTYSHPTANNQNGTIEWMKFSVEIELPTPH